MTMHAFGTRKQHGAGRWWLAGMLMATTALAMPPEAVAQDGSTFLEHPILFILYDVSGDGTVYIGQGPRLGHSGQSAYYGSIDGSL